MDRQRQIERFLQSAHRLAVSRLRADPERLGDVRRVLDRWRDQSGRTRSDAYWNEWDQLLRLPIDELERVICADDAHATVLRSVSPVGVLLSAQESDEVLRQARSG